jgi:hypothetical protein
MKRIIFWGTIFSGVGAVYLMRRRGVSLSKSLQSAISNPFGTLIAEVKGDRSAIVSR